MNKTTNYSSNALFTDFYELTMAQGYWKEGMNQKVIFDMFFRRNPFNGGFSVLAGNETLLDAITEFSFSEDDIKYLEIGRASCRERVSARV